MLKLFYKKDGAVTIFLILILVPVLALTGIFVEISRVELAKPVIASSADLALNTALTNYDTKLKDYYGLMGSVQNTSNTLDVAEEYFKNCINSKLVDENEMEELWDKVTSIANNTSNLIIGSDIISSEEEKISNLLQTELPELTVSEVKNANLANPVFLQSQIVEFMKYRAPVELVTGLFQNLSTQAETLKNLEQDRELQKKEQETYEAENELLQRLYDVYDRMQDYNQLAINETYLSTMNTDIGGTVIKDMYAIIHRNAVKRYINVDMQDDIFQVFKQQIPSATVQTDLYIYKESDVDKIKAILTGSNSSLSYIKKLIEAQKNLENALSVSNTGINYEDDIDRLQYTLQIYHKSGVSSAIAGYYNVTSSFWDNYKMVKKIYECCVSNPALKQALNDFVIDNIYSYYSDYDMLETSMANSDNISNLYDLLKYTYQFYKDCEEKYIRINSSKRSDKNSYMYTLNIMEQTVQDVNIANEVEGTADNDSLNELWNKLYNYSHKMEEADAILKDIQAMIEGTGKYASEGSLYKLAKEYSSNLETWKNSANYSTTEGSYCIESGNRAQEAIDNKRDISTEEIDVFLLRIKAIEEYCSGVNKYIVSDTKYGERSIFEINSVYGASTTGLEKVGFAQAAEEIISPDNINGRVTNNALNQLADGKFPFIYGTQQIVPDESNHPVITKNTPELYSYMDEMFKDKVENKEIKKKYEEYKNSDEAKEDKKIDEEEDTSICEITGLEAGNYPSGFTGTADSISILSPIISLATGLFTDFEGTLTNARDELYVTEYCMNMFSYATFESEMKLSYMKEHDLKEEQIKKLSTSVASNGMVNELVKTIGAETTKNEINELKNNEDPNETANKSLTNKPINESNNYAYQREIEYILFGGTNADNIKNVKQELFKLRYALNIIPGYKLFWGNKIIKSIADAVSAASMGIIPAPLVRVAMILILVGVESWNDINLLMEGISVKFIKYGKDAESAEWVFSADAKFGGDLAELALSTLGIENDSVNIENNQSTDNTFRVSYSQYLTFLLYFQLTSGDTNKVNNVYKRIGDVIQANMSKRIYNIDDYKLSNCITQYQLSYSAVVRPLMLNLGIYNDYNTEALINEKRWRTISGIIYRGY